MVVQCLNFFQQIDSNAQILKSLLCIDIPVVVQKDVFSKLRLNILTKLQELHNDYPLATDDIEIKRQILSKYQLLIADFYNIPTDYVEKLFANFFDKEKYVLHYENLQLYLRLGLKPKTTSRIRIQSIITLKAIY